MNQRNNHTNIMLAAGKGERFRSEYSVPKPLIPVDGQEMVLRSASFLPQASSYIFVCLTEHLKHPYELGKKIQVKYPNANIVSIDQTTMGQASTALLAKSVVSSNASLTIASCDCGVIYTESVFEKLLADEETDAIVWTFRNDPVVKNNPNAWGWVQVDNKGFVTKISVKKPLSKNVSNDHAIIGWFSFKNANKCFSTIEEMIQDKDMIQNEFYLDRVLGRMVERGQKVRVFEVDTYLGWGTPDALRSYEKKS